MKAILEVTNGEFMGRKLALRSPVRMSVGRTVMADYVIPYDPQMSGVHFELDVEADGACLRDVGSTNGTFVNDERVAMVQLGDGDVIRAGGTCFSILFEEPPVPVLKPATHTGTVPSSAWDPNRALAPGGGQPKLQPESQPALVKEGHADYILEDDQQRSSQPLGLISSTRPFEQAFHDPEPAVVLAALEAAAWTRQPWLLDYCREQCRELSSQRLMFYQLLATLAGPGDLPAIQLIAQESRLGAARMSVVGMFGHPGLLPFLVEHFANTDARTAVAAGRAFQKIVGGDFESAVRVTLPPQDGSRPDEFEAEFLDEEKLPDSRQAQTYLQQHGETLSQSHRWSRGRDVSQPLSRELFMQLDLESRWEAALRGVYRGELLLTPAQLLKLRPSSTA